MSSALFDHVARSIEDTTERVENGITIGQDADMLAGNLREFVRRAWPLLEPDRIVDGKRRSTFRTNWHIDAICDHLEACRALQIRRLLINIPPRHMKPESVDTLVLLADGRRVRLGDLVAGDSVITHRGRARTVEEVQDVGELECVRVVTHSGRVTVPALEHPMLTPEGWVKASDLKVGDHLALVVPESLEGEADPHEVRLAAYLIGDGNVTGNAAVLTSFDEAVTADAEACAAALGFTSKRSKVAGRLNLSGGVRPWLREIGLAGKSSYTKRVPDFVMEGGMDAAKHFVAGYFACDGTLNRKGGKRRDLLISFTSVSFGLLDDVQHLLLRLGIPSRIRHRVTTAQSFKEGVPFGVLEIAGADATARFVQRIQVVGAKKERLDAWAPQRTTFDQTVIPDRIVLIEPTTAECRCIQVEEDASYTGDDFAAHNSLTVSVFWPVWRWTFEPELRFLTFSYADDLAQRDAVKSRDVLRSQWYRDRWPNVILKPDVNRLDRYENTLTGHRIAEHVRSGTGEGGDVLVIDDPHDAERALSDERAKVLRWHSNTASSRFNDPATGVQVVVMQRLHEKDLSGHVLAQDGWTHLCLPARFDPKHPFTWPDDPRTEYGEVLWEEHVPKVELDRLQAGMTARDIAGQFQQIPAPLEGDLLKTKDWRYYDRELSYYAERRVFDAGAVAELRSALGEFRHIIHSWDTSVKDRANSDSVSCTVWGAVDANRYMLRTLNEKLGLNATIEAMAEIGVWAHELWPDSVHWIVVEEAANGPDAIRELKKRLNGVIAWPAKGTKGMRAEAASTTLVGHNCYLPGAMLDDGSGYAPNTPPAVQAFIERLARCAFDGAGKSIGGPDDDCDSWSMAMNYLRTQGSGIGRTSVPQGRTD